MSLPNKSRRYSNWRTVFGAPILIGAISLAGLFTALLSGDSGRYISWPAVGLPVLVVLWVGFRSFFIRS